jgi:predicted transcriptional regulator
MGISQYSRKMSSNASFEPEAMRHRRLVAALEQQLEALGKDPGASDVSSSMAPASEESDPATREVLEDAALLAGILEGLEDALAGRVHPLEDVLSAPQADRQHPPRTRGGSNG